MYELMKCGNCEEEWNKYDRVKFDANSTANDYQGNICPSCGCVNYFFPKSGATNSC